MSKKKSRNKQNHNQPGDRGMFYSQKLCPVCKKLIVASNPKSYEGANRDLGRTLKAHQEEHQKEKQGGQLELSIPGREEKQMESIKRVTLRGEKKSV